MFGDRILLFDRFDLDVGNEIILLVIFDHLLLISSNKLETVFVDIDLTLYGIGFDICIYLFSPNRFD